MVIPLFPVWYWGLPHDEQSKEQWYNCFTPQLGAPKVLFRPLLVNEPFVTFHAKFYLNTVSAGQECSLAHYSKGHAVKLTNFAF